MTACESFGSTLRQQRERQGLTLAAIAERTKIGPQMLRLLERGDMSRLPGGIYRRSFVRAYAAAVGLPPEPTLCEFVRLFPEPGQDPPALLDGDPERLRLTLVTESRWKAPALRLAAAVADAAVVLLVAYVVSTPAGIGFWASAGVVGLTCHATAAILVGQSPGAWLVASGSVLRRPRGMRNQFADLRQGWLPALVEAGEGGGERHATT